MSKIMYVAPLTRDPSRCRCYFCDVVPEIASHPLYDGSSQVGECDLMGESHICSLCGQKLLVDPAYPAKRLTRDARRILRRVGSRRGPTIQATQLGGDAGARRLANEVDNLVLEAECKLEDARREWICLGVDLGLWAPRRYTDPALSALLHGAQATMGTSKARDHG